MSTLLFWELSIVRQRFNIADEKPMSAKHIKSSFAHPLALTRVFPSSKCFLISAPNPSGKEGSWRSSLVSPSSASGNGEPRHRKTQVIGKGEE